VVTINGDPWFVARDVLKVIGLTNITMSLAPPDASEKGFSQIDTLGGKQRLAVISESGLYKLIMRSCKPQAKPFQDCTAAKSAWCVERTLV
jgi:prophage antirepressor-like protein